MAFPTALKVLGPALTATAEGLQAVPQYIDKDEELVERHEDRLARRELRPLTLEEARLRLQKTREELERPKPISAGAHGSYIFNPATRKYEYDAQSAALGGMGETAYIRKLRSLSVMAADKSNPMLAAAAEGELKKTAGIKDTAQLQSMRRYFGALERGEDPAPEDTQLMQIIVNRSVRGSAEGGYYPFNAPLPGASVTASPAIPVPAPGSAVPAQPGTSRTAPAASQASPQARSYQGWFQRAGEGYAKQTMDNMLKEDPQMQKANTKAALRGFLSAYPNQMEVVDTLPPENAVPPAAGRPAVAAPVAPTGPSQPGSGPTPKRIADTVAAERRAKGLPAYTHDEVAVARRLHARGIIPSSDLATMDDANFTKIQDYLDTRKQEPLFQRRVKEAEPQIAALDAIEMAEKVSGDIYPLLNWRSVGLGGFLSNAWQTATSAIGAYRDPNDKKTLTQAVDATRRVIDLAKTRGDINQVLAENPQAAQDMMNPSAPTVRVLAAVLAYLHASAIKKGASSGSRNVAVTDVRLANELFDPVAWTSSPSAIREKLVALQTSYLRPEKKVVEKALTLKGIDPMTRKPVKGFHFSAEPGGDVGAPTAKELLDESDEAN